jgi:hypothetical protein
MLLGEDAFWMSLLDHGVHAVVLKSFRRDVGLQQDYSCLHVRNEVGAPLAGWGFEGTALTTAQEGILMQVRRLLSSRRAIVVLAAVLFVAWLLF